MINLNAQGNCASDVKGTGLAACVKEYGDLRGIDLYPKGYFVNLATGSYPTEAEYEAMVQNGELYPLNNLYDFEQATPDNDIATSSTGIKKQIRSGKPEYSITWSDGGCYHRGVYDKKGFNRWDIVFKFESGVLYTYNASETELKAFAAGMFDVNTFKFQQGTDPDMTTVNFQLTKVNEMNLRQNFVTWDALGYDMTEVNGVLDVDVAFVGTPSAGTDFVVSVKSSCNADASIESLTELDNWLLGGTQASSTAISAVSYNSANEEYTITVDTPLVSADTIVLSLKGASGEDAAKDAAGNFFKGSTSSATIA